jgi:hypothetical protein
LKTFNLSLDARLPDSNVPIDQTLDRTPIDKMFLNNNRNVFGLYSAVPNPFRINYYSRPECMMSGATGPRDQNFFCQLPAIHFLAELL